MKKLPQQNNTQPTPSQKRPGSVKDAGHQFEVKMAALIGLRGLQKGDKFELFSNIDGAGNFDDLVYTAGGRRYFLQLKHTDNVDKKKLTKGELVTLLQKCFQSYCAIRYGDTFKDVSIDNSDFIIYTNKEIMPNLLGHKRRQRDEDIFFKTSDKGEIFSFSPNDENKEFDLYTLLENYLKESKEFCHFCDRHIVTEFLNKLIMGTGQKGQRELDEVIIEEIRKDDAANVDDDVYSAELLEFKTLVETWCRDTKEKMTATMFRNWLQKAKTMDRATLVRSLYESYTMKLARTGIKFTDSEISWLQAELSNKREVHLRSDALTLSSVLLLDCLPQSKCIFVTLESLQCNEKKLLNAWLGSHWEWLIVSCDATVQQHDISKTCRDIRRHITPAISKKYFIILTHYSVQEIQTFTPIDHKFKFEQLSKESQAMVLDKKIDFQGCEVTMRSVLQGHGNVEHVLGPELVTDLITEGTAVNIGGKLHVNTGYYAPRYFKRKIYLKLDVLRNSDSYPDIFAVSGIEKKYLVEIVPADETVGEFCLDEDSATGTWTESYSNFETCRFFILRSKNLRLSFRKLCELYSGETLHWLKFKDGDLLWKETYGDIGTVPDCIDAAKTGIDKGILRDYMSRGSCEVNEESIWDLGERTVLVVAEPGMGKSSTTTQVAWRTKQRDPTSWVVRINWNDHTRELQEIDAATFNLDTLVEFFCSAAFPDSKYTDINRSLLKQALQSSGNVTVLMDGFDEISPTYADKAAVILSELMETKVGRVWVTSRPVQKERLENELSVIAYGMKRLSRKSQKDMLFILWKHKAGDEKIISKLLDFIKDFQIYLSEFIYNDNFTGCPLYITMLATVYEMEVETFLNSKVWIEPRIDLVNLYEKFVVRKLHIYNSSVFDNLEVLKEIYFIRFEKCALAAILPPPMLESLHKETIEEDTQPFLCKVQDGKDNTGTVMTEVEGKPQFVHRTFAEYFTARWLSEHFKSNRSVLEHILFDPKYSFMTDMFDRMLAKDCPLHCAVLDRDLKRFETVLKGGCDVNAVDKGGRTVMHIIAKREKEFVHYKRYIQRFIDIFHDYRVSLDATDCVLQWTPWQYAVKSKDWLFVELLLERNVDRSGLDKIMQKAHDPDYIGPIIIHAAEYGYLLLLEFIRSIGVNIHQACSMDFPSPLHAAIWYNKPQVVRWLIKHGADCNTGYSDGQTALHYAVTEGALDVVRALVEEGGASLDVRDDCGRTVIDWAKYCASDQALWKYQEEKWKKIVKYLEKKNVN